MNTKQKIVWFLYRVQVYALERLLASPGAVYGATVNQTFRVRATLPWVVTGEASDLESIPSALSAAPIVTPAPTTGAGKAN